jgi:hypothetical protein
MKTACRLFVVAFVCTVLFAACTYRVPILIYKAQAVTNPNRIPLKIGVNLPVFKQERRLVTVNTRPLGLLFLMGFQLGFPKPDEKEMLADFFVQYVRDTNLFEYAYIHPYDKKDVDLIVDLRVANFRANNNKLIGQLAYLPYLDILWLLPLPQEIFTCEIDMTFDVSTADGRKVLSYSANTRGRDGVSIYGQPYAKYAWTNSIFKKEYFKVLDGFAGKATKDRDTLVKAAEEYRQRRM